MSLTGGLTQCADKGFRVLVFFLKLVCMCVCTCMAWRWGFFVPKQQVMARTRDTSSSTVSAVDKREWGNSICSCPCWYQGPLQRLRIALSHKQIHFCFSKYNSSGSIQEQYREELLFEIHIVFVILRLESAGLQLV